MAVTATNLVNQAGMAQGRGRYRYDTLDLSDTVETANYFNNLTNVLGLAKGDLITVVSWSTAIFGVGTISQVKDYIVTNVIANDAAASAGAVNIAEYGISTSGAISSGQ